MAGTPVCRRCIAAFLISTSISPTFAAFEQCRLEAIDMVAETAAARCGKETILLEVGDDFRGYSVTALSSSRVTLSEAGSEGATLLWYVAGEDEPSHVRRILAEPPAREDRKSGSVVPAD